jgi:hypothetical protein
MAFKPTIQKLSDGAKNCAVKITGMGAGNLDWVTVVDVTKLNGSHSKVKVDHIEWAITSGIEVFLAWGASEGEHELIVPLGGRGQINFADYGGLSNLSEGKSGHILMMVQLVGPTIPKGVQGFTLFLDMQKQ